MAVRVRQIGTIKVLPNSNPVDAGRVGALLLAVASVPWRPRLCVPEESGEPDRRHDDPDDDQAPTAFLTEAIGAHQAQDEEQEADQLDGRHVWHGSEHTIPLGQPSRPLRGSLAARDTRPEATDT